MIQNQSEKGFENVNKLSFTRSIDGIQLHFKKRFKFKIKKSFENLNDIFTWSMIKSGFGAKTEHVTTALCAEKKSGKSFFLIFLENFEFFNDIFKKVFGSSKNYHESEGKKLYPYIFPNP